MTTSAEPLPEQVWSAAQVRELERRAIERGVSDYDLMCRAGEAALLVDRHECVERAVERGRSREEQLRELDARDALGREGGSKFREGRVEQATR